MASTIRTPDPLAGTVGHHHHDAAAERADTRWMWFAGTIILIYGIINVVYGIAAIDDSRVFVANTEFVFGDLALYGWCLLIVGVVQITAAFGIFAASDVARWVGIACAAVNAVINLLLLPAFPLWCTAVLALDMLVLYALLAHGRRD